MPTIRTKRRDDDAALAALWTEHFGAPVVVSRGRLHDPRDLDGFVAETDGALVGAATFARVGGDIEVVTLDSVVENLGAGSALLDAIADYARAHGVHRLCLVTTNDNIRAIRFYQKRGWNLCALYPDAVVAARRIKPQIPLTGEYGIPIRHEIEFELLLD